MSNQKDILKKNIKNAEDPRAKLFIQNNTPPVEENKQGVHTQLNTNEENDISSSYIGGEKKKEKPEIKFEDQTRRQTYHLTELLIEAIRIYNFKMKKNVSEGVCEIITKGIPENILEEASQNLDKTNE